MKLMTNLTWVILVNLKSDYFKDIMVIEIIIE